MRTIKFRVWDKEHKAFVKPNICFVPHRVSDNYSEMYLEVNEDWENYNPTRFVFLEWTGLTDKNEKEIYEGDIVRILYTDWASKPENDTRTLEQYLIDIANVGHIVYNAPTFEINFGVGKYGDEDFGRIKPGEHGYIEVIGNIYENPELLKAI